MINKVSPFTQTPILNSDDKHEKMHSDDKPEKMHSSDSFGNYSGRQKNPISLMYKLFGNSH